MNNIPAPDALSVLSDALEARTKAASPAVAALDWGGRVTFSALFWRHGVVVTSGQSLPNAPATPPCSRATGAHRQPRRARPGDQLAVLRLEAGAGAGGCRAGGPAHWCWRSAATAMAR